MLTYNRLAFLDNLRVVLIAMVIVHHVGQAYGPTGGWWPVQEPMRAEILGPFFMVNRSFGMSLFFMIAGYFAAMSYDRKGSRVMVMSRLQRLGIPLLGFTLLMMVLQVFVFGSMDSGSLGHLWPVDVIHFWFVQHLLIYCLGYALWQYLRHGAAQSGVIPTNPPGYLTILIFAIGLTLASAIVRTWFDIDEWVYLFGYIRIAPADLPRDLGLFIIGTLAYWRDWVMRFSSRAGYIWLSAGITLAVIWYVYDLWLDHILVFSDTIWGLLMPLWESLLCCSMCVGLTVLFRERLNFQGALAREMSSSMYATYMLHVFVAVFFQLLAQGLPASPIVKLLLVSFITVPVSFLLGSLIRRPLHI